MPAASDDRLLRTGIEGPPYGDTLDSWNGIRGSVIGNRIFAWGRHGDNSTKVEYRSGNG